jgi:uncharacterized cupredoxin-like copper-binding protein
MRALAALSSALVILATACGGATPSAVDPSLGRVIDVTMTEFTFSPATITLAPGEKVTFKLKNTGVVEHDFMAGRGATPGKGYAVDWIAKAVDGATPPHTHAGEAPMGEGVRVSADWILTLTVVVPQEKGEYEFGCFVQGHYEAGMKGKLIVQ